jgi:beta-glucanase (GH16 family)
MKRIFFIFLFTLHAIAQTAPSQAVAAGYTNLVWNPTFSPLNICTGNTSGCDLYNPGAVGSGDQGVITNPTGYLNLNWQSGQGGNYTVVSSISANKAYYKAFTYGYYEISMAFDPDTGNWPALWFQGVAGVGTSPYTGPELDMLEWQSNTPNTYYGTIHSWVSGVSTQQGITPTVSVTWSSYNTYGVLWTPTAISWYLNNTLLGTVLTTTSPYNTIFAGQQQLFLIASVTAGCNFSYPCAGQVSPTNMQIQSIHVFQAPPGTVGTAATTGIKAVSGFKVQ